MKEYSLRQRTEKSALSRLLAIAIFCGMISMVASRATAQDLARLGGDLTTTSPGRFAIQLPAPNVAEGERKDLMLNGFPVFHTIRTKNEGLGPFFVNRSCGGCHVENGKGSVKLSTSPSSSLRGNAIVVQVSRKGVAQDGSPLPVPGVGNVLQERDLRGRRRYNIQLKWRRIRGKYADGSSYTLRRPELSFEIRGKNPRNILSSLRMTPPVIGTGLIEAIPDEAIKALADPNDSDGDGISGKVNLVTNKRANAKTVGKFGFKAVEPTVEQQTLVAFFNEMGVTSSLFPDPKGAPPEISELDSNRIDLYQRLAGVPAARDQGNPDVQAGRAIFGRIGCEKCHVSSLVTSAPNDPELDNQTIHPFSDFLLHDLGEGLSDKRPHFDAAGAEWRTTPLWGLGFAETLSDVKPSYLHDGRASTIAEAILWHGGEGLAARTAFRNLAKAERDQLILFLRSL